MTYDDAYHTAAAALCTVHLDGTILRVNDRFCSRLGYTREQVAVGMDVSTLFTPAGKIYLETHLRPLLLAEGKLDEIALDLRRADRSRIPVLVQVYCNSDRASAEVAILPFAERKNYEREILLSKRRSEALTQELSVINRGLQEFTGTVSHDLKQPVRSIHSYLSVLQRMLGDKLSAPEQKMMQTVMNSASRMDRMVGDLLYFATAQQSMTAKDEVDIHRLLAELCELLDSQLRDCDGQLMLPDTLPTVWGNESSLLRLFQNLVSNALKFMAEGVRPMVRVTYRELEKYHEFSVHDNGIGIPAEKRAMIFEPFERLHPEQAYEGSGIGLATCRKIVSTHGGRIHVEAANDGGSTFVFTLEKRPSS